MTEPTMNSDDYLAALTATRDAIVADLSGCDSMRDRAALYARLESILKLIKAARPAEREGDGIDEIAERRASRRSRPAKAQDRAKRTS